MSELSRNIALGAAAVGTGAALVGATLLTNNRSLTSTNPTQDLGGIGSAVTVTVAEIHPSVTLTSPSNGDVFLNPSISLTSTYQDTLGVGYTLTAPNGNTCELPSHIDSSLSGSYTTTFDVSTCQGGARGVYALKAYLIGNENVYSEIDFTYSIFSLEHTIYDANADPILMVHYGEGIGLVHISTTCNGSANPVAELDYVTERNEDSIDEVLIPLKNKNVTAGNCTATATAKKANGDPINSQDVTGATVQTTFTYTGL